MLDLKRVPPKSRPAAPSPSRKRPARTPPSTFLFLLIHLSNSPGSWPIPAPVRRKARRSSKPPTVIGRRITLISEELRRRAIAPCGGAPKEPYIGFAP